MCQRLWDFSSLETADTQRLRLIHQFLDLDEIPAEWDPTLHAGESEVLPSRIPTVEEVDTILRPWRSDNVRKMAWKIWGSHNGQPILLRTHYDPQNDDKVAELLLISDEFDEKNAWWAILDDHDLFDFGDQWWLVFDILPELAGPLQIYSRLPLPEFVTRGRQSLKAKLPRLKLTDEWKTNPYTCIEAATTFFRRTLTNGYFTIADREGFKTNTVRLVYLDGKQNIVQETRMDFDEQTFTDIAVEWDQLSLPVELWEEGTVGEKYRANGELGRELYQLDDADLES
ncbi:hypothetical protein PHISP_04696 [Aspergillus sp. HF37]|nr:hypothetical protein PHISP_04696 [Aspergillus sp. HF37]